MVDLRRPRLLRLIPLTVLTIAVSTASTHADTPTSKPQITTPASSASAPSAPQAQSFATKQATVKKPPEMTIEQFLDLLMVAESGGNDQARNPLSTATGAYQFIESTFLYVMRRHFPKRIENLTNPQILALRTDRQIARDAAQAFTKDNATQLVAAGHASSFPHLRLAFLLGVGGAIQILNAKPDTPLSSLVGPAVIRANPWMSRHTAQTLIARSAREVSLSPNSIAGISPRRDPITGELMLPKRVSTAPSINVRCNLARPSCKRWLSLKRKSLASKTAAGSKRRVADNR